LKYFFSFQIETVNCASIVRKDQEATNGIVHVVDSLLDPALTVPRDLAELVLQVRSPGLVWPHLNTPISIQFYNTCIAVIISIPPAYKSVRTVLPRCEQGEDPTTLTLGEKGEKSAYIVC
jgi:hypothetical protein